MPTPPQPNESHEDFMGRCMSYMKEHEPGKEHDQQVAICMSMWRRARSDEGPQEPK